MSDIDLSSALRDRAGSGRPGLRLFFCPACGGVWRCWYAPVCSGTADAVHERALMRRADDTGCGNTAGLIVDGAVAGS